MLFLFSKIIYSGTIVFMPPLQPTLHSLHVGALRFHVVCPAVCPF